MEWLKEITDKYINGKPTKAELIISYTLLGLSIAGFIAVLTLVIIRFVS